MFRRAGELTLYAASPLAIIVTSPLLAQGLGVEARGQLGVAQSVAALATSIGALGQAEVLLGDLRSGKGSPLAASMVAFGGSLVVGVGTAAALHTMRVDPATIVAVLILLPWMSQAPLWRGYAVSRGQLLRPAYANALGAMLRVALVAALAMSSRLAAVSAFWAVQGSAVVAAVVVLGVNYVRGVRSTQAEGELPNRVEYLRRGAPLVLFAMFTAVTLNADVLMLSWLGSASALGVYAATASLSLAALSVSAAFKSRVQLAAFSSRSLASVKRELAIVILAGGVAASAVAFGSSLVVQVLLGPGYEAAEGLVQILAFASWALVLLDCMHGLLAALGLRRGLVAVGAVGAASTLVFLAILVPLAGAEGAAWATLVSYSLAAIAGWLIARRSGALS